MDKEIIRKQKEDEKFKKQFEKLIEKSIKPPECFKLLIACIKSSIYHIETGSQFLENFTSLEGPEYECDNSETFLPHSIRWIFKEQLLIYENNKWNIKDFLNLDIQSLLLIPGSDFIKLILNDESNIFKVSSLDHLIEQINESGYRVTFVLVGIDHEILLLKKSKVMSKYGKLNAKVIENILINLQFHHNICTIKMSNYSDAGKFAMGFSKSIAQRQIKMKSSVSDDLFGFSLNQGASCQVDTNCSDGQLGGVDYVWRTQLKQFRGVEQAVADAIQEKYSTPKHMFDCVTRISLEFGEKEAIESIANIEVRRGTGVVANTRKVGKEIATKIYKFITVPDDDGGNII